MVHPRRAMHGAGDRGDDLPSAVDVVAGHPGDVLCGAADGAELLAALLVDSGQTLADCGLVRSAGHRAGMTPAVNPCSSTLKLTVTTIT